MQTAAQVKMRRPQAADDCAGQDAQTTDHRPQTADRRSQIADRRSQTADRRPQTAGQLSRSRCVDQTADGRRQTRRQTTRRQTTRRPDGRRQTADGCCRWLLQMVAADDCRRQLRRQLRRRWPQAECCRTHILINIKAQLKMRRITLIETT